MENTNIYNLFNFIEDKYPQYRTPVILKLANNEPLNKQELDIEGSISLMLIDSIKTLPNNLKVKGSLDLHLCKNLESLPRGLEVGRELVLSKTNIKELPSDLKVKDYIVLMDTPLSEKYTEAEIKEMCPGIKGDIYL
jgi:hypothetical protein